MVAGATVDAVCKAACCSRNSFSSSCKRRAPPAISSARGAVTDVGNEFVVLFPAVMPVLLFLLLLLLPPEAEAAAEAAAEAEDPLNVMVIVIAGVLPTSRQ